MLCLTVSMVLQLVKSSCSIGVIIVETTVCWVGYFPSDPVLVFCSLSRAVVQSV